MVNVLTLPYIPAVAHGGTLRNQRLWVCHSTEGPMSRGNARSLAGPNWFGGPQAGTSAHAIFDPGEGVEMVKPDIVAYHVGPGGNGLSLGSEHCGKVSLTKEQWLSADGTEMLRRSAQWTAQYCHKFGIDPVWGKLPEIDGGRHCMCTHNDIRLVFGGTTHSDPGPNFPYPEYQEWVQEFFYNRVEDDMANTPEQLAAGAYAGLKKYLTERRRTGEKTPVESLEMIDNIKAQGETNGSMLSALQSDVRTLKATVDKLITALGQPPTQ